MSDIFISYASEDLERVLPLVNALEKTAWSVFWDRTIPAGKTWRQVIGAEIQGCRTVIVVWTENSVNSEWVQEEAEIGRRRKILVPVLLDKVEPPFGFGSIQAANLVAWRGENASPAFNRLVADIAAVLGPAPAAMKEQEGTDAELLGSLRSDAEERRTAEEDRLREQERERIVARGANQRRVDLRLEQTWFQRRLALVRRLYGPTMASAAVAVLITFIVILRWPTLQPNKETAVQAPLTSVESDKLISAAPEKQMEAPKEMPQGPVAELKQEKQIATQFSSVGKTFRDRLKSGTEGPEMVVVPAGSFQMGNVEGGGEKDETPVHAVTIQKPFAIGRYEGTFDEYDQFAKATNRKLPADQGWGRGHRPVINVSWEDVNAYVKWLSEQTGKRYRLPTEADWEYAARAGKETAYWWGNDFIKGMANCNGCGSQWDNKQTAPVGSFKPNALGLYDTAGNVWEWVEDCYHENFAGAPSDGRAWLKEKEGQCDLRVLRGGSWNNTSWSLRSPYRFRYDLVRRNDFIGFRLAQDLP
jgi:formylglycine-generating enzyme required for sulfatase activity